MAIARGNRWGAVKTAKNALFENPAKNALLKANKTLTFFIGSSDV
jgi:hypothetical protein